MAAFFPVTDSLTGEPVIVNADRIQHIAERRSSAGEISTVINFSGVSFIQAREDILTIYSRIMRLGLNCLNMPQQWTPLQTGGADGEA